MQGARLSELNKPRSRFAAAIEGAAMIRSSPYLMHVCAYLILNYMVSSFF